MNFQPVQFNPNEAEKAGQSSPFFEGNSEQLVKITRAEFVQSRSSGAQGIEFDVVNKEEQKAYFTIWHVKSDGSPNDISMRNLQALMGVCGVHNLTPTMMNVPKYDFDRKDTVQTNCTNAKELLGKFFTGLFVEVYSVYNGEKKTKIELFQPFDKNRKSYREMNAGTPAQDIEEATQSMIRKSQKSAAETDKQLGNNTAQPQQQYGPQIDNASFNDDAIPF